MGHPEPGSNARSLGIRPGLDVPALLDSEWVAPGQGGLSASPDTPMSLPRHRRPPAFLGVGRDPVWTLDTEDLGLDLAWQPDAGNSGHGFVEPSRIMPLRDYQDALAETRDLWRRVDSPP